MTKFWYGYQRWASQNGHKQYIHKRDMYFCFVALVSQVAAI